jgi:hypothetical protein
MTGHACVAWAATGLLPAAKPETAAATANHRRVMKKAAFS